MSKFSVIIPTRNRPQLLTRAIESVAGQKHVDLEIIIVNDGNQPIVGLSEPHIKILDNLNQGPVAARNLGVDHSNGEIIAFLDDDDQWTDDFFLSKAQSVLQMARCVLTIARNLNHSPLMPTCSRLRLTILF